MMKCKQLHGYHQIEVGELKVNILPMLSFRGTCYAIFLFYLNYLVNFTATEDLKITMFYFFMI